MIKQILWFTFIWQRILVFTYSILYFALQFTVLNTFYSILIFSYFPYLNISSIPLLSYFLLKKNNNKPTSSYGLNTILCFSPSHMLVSDFQLNILSRKQLSLAKCTLGSHLEMTSKFTFPFSFLYSHILFKQSYRYKEKK